MRDAIGVFNSPINVRYWQEEFGYNADRDVRDPRSFRKHFEQIRP